MIRDALNRAFWACYFLILVWGAIALWKMDYILYVLYEVM